MSAKPATNLLDDCDLGLIMFNASSSIEADRLATLALEAATAIDAAERGAGLDIVKVRDFADAVTKFTGVGDTPSREAYWLDPSSSEMFSSALKRATHRNIPNIDTLNAELQSILSDLRKGLETDKSSSAIKKFCLEIHGFILRARVNVGLHESGVFDYDHSYSG